MDAQKGPVEMTRITFIEANICLGLQNTSELMVVEGRLIRFFAYMLIDIPTLLASKARPFPPAFFHTNWPVRFRNLGAYTSG